MAASVRRVTTVHVCSSVPNLASYLSKRLPHIKVIDVPAGCSEGRYNFFQAEGRQLYYTSLGKIPHRSLFAFEHCASVNVYREELTLGITENPHVLAY